MEIDAKIGTGPHSKIKVGWKRKSPKVNEWIKFKTLPLVHGEKWRKGRVCEIRNLVFFKLYYLSL